MKRKTEIVSFRADGSLLARIDKARQPIELSRGDWVREVVIARFHLLEEAEEWPAQLADFRQALDEQDLSLKKLNSNHRRALYIMLTTIGQLDPNQAKEITRCKLQS